MRVHTRHIFIGAAVTKMRRHARHGHAARPRREDAAATVTLDAFLGRPGARSQPLRAGGRAHRAEIAAAGRAVWTHRAGRRSTPLAIRCDTAINATATGRRRSTSWRTASFSRRRDAHRSRPTRRRSCRAPHHRSRPAAGARDRSARRLLERRPQPLLRHDLLDPAGACSRGTGRCASFLRPGSHQLAAGLVVYGPRLSLVLSVGEGTHIFEYSDRTGGYRALVAERARSAQAKEFAINASNYRHWDEFVRLYFDDCVKGVHGPRERDFNMRWLASLVVEAYRILVRGGVFLYPADKRPGYGNGRLRLVYEANPVAFLMEQAGRQRHQRHRPDPLAHAREPAPAHAADLRVGAGGRQAHPLPHRSERRSASARRSSASAACSGA